MSAMTAWLRRDSAGGWGGKLCYLASLLLLFSVSTIERASAQLPAPVEAQLAALLRAGEFPAAIEMARGVGEPAARDRLLGLVAVAQAGQGARRAAVDTLSSMRDDRYRSQALSEIGRQMPGPGAAGGASQADFDTLMELIRSTVAPQTWSTVGGPGAIDAFPGGVYVDHAGLMKRLTIAGDESGLAVVRQQSLHDRGNQDCRKQAELRKVSLPRLEREVQLLWAFGKPPTEAMRMLAGLQRVKYVFVYPETGDVVLAGPAGDWHFDAEGRPVSADGGVPVVQLDDFVVLLRNAQHEAGKFTCSITPRRESLAAAQAFLNESAKTPLKSEQRPAWLANLRRLVGKQAIEVQGLDARTRAARVIVEADYRMKLVGMGLEEGVFGVTSYLDSIEVAPGESPPPMSVLRWWFTTNYAAVKATPQRDAFEWQGSSVKVLSENEMLTARGERVHTGKSDVLNEQFAHSFSQHFDALATKYPIYAELRNVFDLALVAALLVAEDLPGRVQWHVTHFGDPQRHQVGLGVAPTDVESVVNHRVIQRKYVVAGVSGGVLVDTGPLAQRAAITIDQYGALHAGRAQSAPKDLPPEAWWWD